MKYLNSNYSVGKDWSENENQDKILEGTGSLVLDRANRIAYVTESERSSADLARQWAESHNYELVLVKAFDENRKSIYHTNVVLAVGSSFAVIASESIDQSDRNRILDKLKETKTVIEITFEQLRHFCGNILEVQGKDGKKVLVMSSQAYNFFSEEQKNAFKRLGIDRIIHSDISLLEKIGGGSARCMMAELY